jgi:hypothetical protein
MAVTCFSPCLDHLQAVSLNMSHVNKAIMGPSNATILLLLGPINALLIIHTQQEATPQ